LKIKSLNIKNFKSIVDITINEPNPFTVFVGPNGSGKSNIFEALEFMSYSHYPFNKAPELFGGEDLFLSRKNPKSFFEALIEIEEYEISTKKLPTTNLNSGKTTDEYHTDVRPYNKGKGSIHNLFLANQSRIFINNLSIQKENYRDSSKLTISCDNLEKVLKRILEKKNIKEQIVEWLELFIPGFKDIGVRKSEFNSNEDLLIYQKYYDKPFNKELVSNGTYNILCLLTAVFQIERPQFLCIEEPENGLNPFVIRKLVDFFRQACEEKGHYIWLNTHSQTLVECLTPEELIVVDKINGETQVKQFKGMDLHGLDMSEVWLSGALGGGTPW